MLKATAIISSSTVVVTLLNLVRVKIVAVLLGPAGLAILAQLNQFVMTAGNLASFGMAPGTVRFTSTYAASSPERLAAFLRTMLVGVGGGAILLLGLSLVLHRPLAQWLLQDNAYAPLLIFAILAIPAQAFFVNLRAAINGFLEISTYARVGILAALANVLFLVPLVYFYQLPGAAVHVLLLACISFAVALFEFLRIRRKRGLSGQRSRFIWSELVELLKYGGTSLAAGATVDVAMLGVRALLIRDLSEIDAGLFQAAFVLSAQAITIVIDGICTYAYPRISELKGVDEAVAESNAAIRLALLIVTPLIVAVYLFRDQLFLLLYSEAFLLASTIIAWQLLGNFIKAVSSTMGVLLLPYRKLRAFLVVESGYGVIFFFAVLLLLPHAGLQAATIGYALGYLFHLVAIFWYVRRHLGFRLQRRNLRLLLQSAALVLLVLFVLPAATVSQWLLVALLCGLWLVFSLEKGEWRALLAFVQKNRNS